MRLGAEHRVARLARRGPGAPRRRAARRRSRPPSRRGRPRRPAQRCRRRMSRGGVGHEPRRASPGPPAGGRAAGTSARWRRMTRRPIVELARSGATSRARRGRCAARGRGAGWSSWPCGPRICGARRLGERRRWRRRGAPRPPPARRTRRAARGRTRGAAGAGRSAVRRRRPGCSAGLDPDEALVGERLEAVEDVEAERRRPGRRPTSASSAVKPPAKTPSRRNRAALRLGQQVVAPGHRAAQRPLALGHVARTAGEVEARRQPLEDERRAEQADARRGELDRERQPEEALADLANDRRASRRRARGRAGGPSRAPRTARRRRRGRAAGPDGRARRRSAGARGS